MTTLPGWANWLARDEDGDLYVFKNKPFKRIRLGAWVNECGWKMVYETDNTFETVKWEDECPTIVDKDVANITVDETHSISFEQAMRLVENKVDDIADKRYETPDIINEPNHYKGKHGIETIDVIRNFGNDDMVAGFYWGNAIKYMTRYRNKNGLEDLKKARRNLDWLIEHTEKVE